MFTAAAAPSRARVMLRALRRALRVAFTVRKEEVARSGPATARVNADEPSESSPFHRRRIPLIEACARLSNGVVLLFWEHEVDRHHRHYRHSGCKR
jgi:hypothetical protein